jgi:hypothetical protein
MSIDVVGENRRDRPAKEDGVPLGGNPLASAVPTREAVGDHERRQGERHQRRYPVAGPKSQRAVRSDLRDGPDEHAARSGHRVLHFPPSRDDIEHLGADRRTVTVMLLRELAVGRGVEVERLDGDADLVRPDLRCGVEAAGRLGKHVLVVEDSMQPKGRVNGASHRFSCSRCDTPKDLLCPVVSQGCSPVSFHRDH